RPGRRCHPRRRSASSASQTLYKADGWCHARARERTARAGRASGRARGDQTSQGAVLPPPGRQGLGRVAHVVHRRLRQRHRFGRRHDDSGRRRIRRLRPPQPRQPGQGDIASGARARDRAHLPDHGARGVGIGGCGPIGPRGAHARLRSLPRDLPQGGWPVAHRVVPADPAPDRLLQRAVLGVPVAAHGADTEQRGDQGRAPVHAL
ncbi:hypothetical protein RMCT_2166, partial [Mycolicibacterium thermoresistibile]